MKKFIKLTVMALTAIVLVLTSCQNNKKYIENEYFTTGSTITIYPAAYDGYFVFKQDDMGLGCEVCNQQNESIVYGGRVIFLTSLADKKYYFIAMDDDKTAVAYDDTGKKLFNLDRTKMQQFPEPFFEDISMEHVVIKKKLDAFKAQP